MSKGQTLQDPFLNSLRKDRIPVSIFLVNGIKLQGQIESFDQYVVLLKNTVSQMVYKHAISTVVPARNPRTAGGVAPTGGFGQVSSGMGFERASGFDQTQGYGVSRGGFTRTGFGAERGFGASGYDGGEQRVGGYLGGMGMADRNAGYGGGFDRSGFGERGFDMGYDNEQNFDNHTKDNQDFDDNQENQ